MTDQHLVCAAPRRKPTRTVLTSLSVTTVRERIPELAVLKTIGFTDISVQWLVLAESLVLCLTSAAIGLALSMVLLPAVSYRPALGLNAMHVPPSVFLFGAVVAVVTALVSGLPLARRAARLEVATALAGR